MQGWLHVLHWNSCISSFWRISLHIAKPCMPLLFEVEFVARVCLSVNDAYDKRKEATAEVCRCSKATLPR